MTTTTLPSAGAEAAETSGAGSSDHAALWQAFWHARDRATRNELILAYESLVATVVTRLPANVRAYWESDDLRSFGLLGLVEAIDRWEPQTPANRFATYAMKRIRGAIFDELRRLDWLPRTVRRRVIDYRATSDALSGELGRLPASSEVLAQMGIERANHSEVLVEVQSAQLLHLQHKVSGEGSDDDLPLIDLLVSDEAAPESQVLASERLEEVRAAIARLNERQRMVVTLHFLSGMTQQQIGVVLGVSNSRVCQIEAAAMQALRRLLADTDGGGRRRARAS
jgi:RNA polymerase sigma factor for flagellar operon FliA